MRRFNCMISSPLVTAVCAFVSNTTLAHTNTQKCGALADLRIEDTNLLSAGVIRKSNYSE